MTALSLRDAEAADRLALARLDDDGAPAAMTPALSRGGAKTAGNPSGSGAPSATPAGPPPAHVRLGPAPGSDRPWTRHGALDGEWWPRSRNAQAELPALIAALDAQPGVRVQRLAVHRDEWDNITRKLTASNGRFARVDWFTTVARHTVSVTKAGSREPITLLVVLPAGAAQAAMHAGHAP